MNEERRENRCWNKDLPKNELEGGPEIRKTEKRTQDLGWQTKVIIYRRLGG